MPALASVHTPVPEPIIKVAHALSRHIRADEPIDNRLLRQLFEAACGGTGPSQRHTIRHAYDALELVQILLLASPDRAVPADCNDALADLVNFTARLPTQSIRTEEQLALQQFSTPAPIDWLLGQPRLHQTLYAEAADRPVAAVDETFEGPEPGPRMVGLSQRLTDELAIQRRDILAVRVAADPDFALDLAIFLMVDRTGHGAERYASSLCARSPQDPVVGFKTPEAAATLARAEASEALDRSWTAMDTVEGRFDAFRALGPDQRAAWLGQAVAGSLEASIAGTGSGACRFHDHLGRLLGIDVALW